MIIIHCEAQKLRNGNRNPKNYPWWPELLKELKEYEFIQIGVEGDNQYTSNFKKNLSFNEIKQLTKECQTWIAIDSFYQHLAWELNNQVFVYLVTVIQIFLDIRKILILLIEIIYGNINFKPGKK